MSKRTHLGLKIERDKNRTGLKEIKKKKLLSIRSLFVNAHIFPTQHTHTHTWKWKFSQSDPHQNRGHRGVRPSKCPISKCHKKRKLKIFYDWVTQDRTHKGYSPHGIRQSPLENFYYISSKQVSRHRCRMKKKQRVILLRTQDDLVYYTRKRTLQKTKRGSLIRQTNTTWT